MTIRDLTLKRNTKIAFLATGQQLSWENEGQNVRIKVPPYDPDRIKVQDAYVLKISDVPYVAGND